MKAICKHWLLSVSARMLTLEWMHTFLSYYLINLPQLNSCHSQQLNPCLQGFQEHLGVSEDGECKLCKFALPFQLKYGCQEATWDVWETIAIQSHVTTPSVVQKVYKIGHGRASNKCCLKGCLSSWRVDFSVPIRCAHNSSCCSLQCRLETHWVSGCCWSLNSEIDRAQLPIWVIWCYCAQPETGGLPGWHLAAKGVLHTCVGWHQTFRIIFHFQDQQVCETQLKDLGLGSCDWFRNPVCPYLVQWWWLGR